MANILLNEFNLANQRLLRSQLARKGHIVWVAENIGEIVTILHDVAIDLMILDLNRQNLDELFMFADRWKGVLILFQIECVGSWEDFCCWMADEVVCKNEDNIPWVVSQLLQKKLYEKTRQRQNRPAARIKEEISFASHHQSF